MSKLKENGKKQKVLSWIRELNEVIGLQKKLGRFKLKTPIQKGWRAVLRVRPGLLKQLDGARHARFLPYVQNIWYSRTTDFTIESKFQGRVRKIEDHAPISLTEKKFRRMMDKEKFPDFYETKYFVSFKNFGESHSVGSSIIAPIHYRVKRPDIYETVIEKNFISEIPIIDPELESRFKILDNKITRENGWQLIYGRYSGYYRGTEADKYKNILRAMEDEVREELKMNECPKNCPTNIRSN